MNRTDLRKLIREELVSILEEGYKDYDDDMLGKKHGKPNFKKYKEIADKDGLENACYVLYSNYGASAVCDFIDKYFPTTDWEYCPECEEEYPAKDGSCLVCGSDTEPE